MYNLDSLNNHKVSQAPNLNKQLTSTRKWGRDPNSNANSSKLNCVTNGYLNYIEEVRMESVKLRDLGKNTLIASSEARDNENCAMRSVSNMGIA